MKNRDRMRKAIEEKKDAEAKTEEAPREKTPPDQSQKAVKEPPVAKITHSCGHTRAVKDLENTTCQACRNKERKRKNLEKVKARNDQRLQMEKPAEDTQRLPDDSHFEASYHAKEKRWTGCLTVRTGPHMGEVKEFKDDSGAVMKLLKKLDAQYRAWLAVNKATEA